MIERHRVREIARHAAAHGRIDAQFPSASAQQRFDLRVAFEALRHARHFLPDALRAPEIPVATQVVVRLPELLPALDKAVGALERIGAQHPLFDASFSLYESSFPPNERRTRADHLLALQDTDFLPLGAVEDDRLLADVFVWQTEDFVYLEHFAVQPSQHSKVSHFVSVVVVAILLPTVMWPAEQLLSLL